MTEHITDSRLGIKYPYKSRPSMVGRIPWNKGLKTGYNEKQAKQLIGRHHSEETKRKISNLNKNRKPYIMTQEIKNKISSSLKGRTIPLEARLKMSKNNARCNLGKKASPELVEKLRLSHLGKKFTAEHIANLIKSRLGKKRSLETCRNISLGKLGKPIPKLQGENHYLWKGGSKNYLKGYRAGYKYVQWRISVFTRDNWTCQTCGIRGTYLEPHHIKGWAKYPEFRYDINNGVTLCLDCHKLTDNYKGKAHRD